MSSDYSHMTQSAKHIDLTQANELAKKVEDLEQARKKQKSSNEELSRANFAGPQSQRNNYDTLPSFHSLQPNYPNPSHNMTYQQTFTQVLTPNTQTVQNTSNSPSYMMSNATPPSSQPILQATATTYPDTNITMGYPQRTYTMEQSPYSTPPSQVPQFHHSQNPTSSYAPFVSIPPPMPNTHMQALYHNNVTTGYPVSVPQDQFVSQTNYYPQMQAQPNPIPWNVPHANAPTSFTNYPSTVVHQKPHDTAPPQKKVVLSNSTKPADPKQTQPKQQAPSSASQSQTIPRDNNALRTETFSAKLKPSGVEVSAILEGAPSVGYLVEFNIRGQTYKGFVLNSSLYKSPVDFMPKDFQYQQLVQHQQQVLQQNGNEARNTISLKELEGAEKVIDVGRTIVSSDIKTTTTQQQQAATPTKEPQQVQQQAKEQPAASKEPVTKEAPAKEQPKDVQTPPQPQTSSPKETKTAPAFKWQCYLCSEASSSSIELTEHIKKAHGNPSTSPPPLESIKKVDQ